MIALALLLQAAPVPPVPSPPRDSYLAAIALWRDNAPSDAEIRSAIDSAVGAVASGALADVGIQVDYRKQSSVGRWLKWYDQMKPVIARHVPADLRQTNAVVADCVVEDLAWTLSPEEITSVRNLFSTTASKKFWSVAGVFREKMKDCYLSALNLKALDADFRNIGLRPPKPPKQTLLHGFVMN
ncbi:hypothetical protein [Sphingomonas sp. PP-CC-3G-468]|uniref:hypothetical protein n=1 Tax=Sphingomonas sp. PP-CC-3G-468 TaxID=2135656 RepID=UPI0010464724|nr:hypothetical protein [Sphingomonas sp. PP-CC-3G-468]